MLLYIVVWNIKRRSVCPEIPAGMNVQGQSCAHGLRDDDHAYGRGEHWHEEVDNL